MYFAWKEINSAYKNPTYEHIATSEKIQVKLETRKLRFRYRLQYFGS